MENNYNVSIIGSVGIPAKYGGFETLVENLADYHSQSEKNIKLTVYCSTNFYPNKAPKYKETYLKYIDIDPHGISSIFYDSYSLLKSIKAGNRIILILGLGAGFILPVTKLFSSSKIIINIDGAEWKRTKFNPLYRLFIKILLRLNLRFADKVICDNQGIADLVKEEIDKSSIVIAYGGDHSQEFDKNINFDLSVPNAYSLALCRIEPENNIEMILKAFVNLKEENIVFVGNWKNSTYGLRLLKKYSQYKNIYLMDPIYDKSELFHLRSKAEAYIHGHSVGGTNPSLVEMMFFEKPTFAFDCIFNRYTIHNHGVFFKNAESLENLILNTKKEHKALIAREALLYAQTTYTWEKIGKNYFDLFESLSK